METIVRAITDLSYDIVGFLLPGFALSVALCLTAAIIWIGDADPSAVRDTNLTLKWLSDAPIAVVLVAVFSTSYLLGAWVKYLAERGAWSLSAEMPTRSSGPAEKESSPPNRYRRLEQYPVFRVMLLRKLASNPRSYLKALQVTFDATANKLATHLGYAVVADDSWLQFYPVARTLARRGLRPSLVQSYQNKYTLARSMAYVIAVWFWLFLIATIASVVLHKHPLPIAEVLVAFVAAFWLIRALLLQFEMQWTAWGSIVIAESALIMSELEREKPGKGAEETKKE